MTWKQICHLISTDIQRRIAYEQWEPAWWNSWAAFFTPGNVALTVARLLTYSSARRIPLVPRLLYLLNLLLFNSEIQAGAKFGEGCLFLSPCGHMISANATIGRNCTFVNQLSVIIGPRIGMDVFNDRIVIGDDVVVHAGVRIIGNLTIGDRCHIGPNKVIRDSLPAGTVLA